MCEKLSFQLFSLCTFIVQNLTHKWLEIRQNFEKCHFLKGPPWNSRNCGIFKFTAISRGQSDFFKILNILLILEISGICGICGNFNSEQSRVLEKLEFLDFVEFEILECVRNVESLEFMEYVEMLNSEH